MTSGRRNRHERINLEVVFERFKKRRAMAALFLKDRAGVGRVNGASPDSSPQGNRCFQVLCSPRRKGGIPEGDMTENLTRENIIREELEGDK
jgi:hypothetical protein